MPENNRANQPINRAHQTRPRSGARWQSALFRLSAELVEVVKENDICTRVVNSLHDTLGYDFVAIFLLDESSGNRLLAASVGYENPPSPIKPGLGLSERPLLDGQLHYTADVTQDPRYFYGMGGSELDLPVRIGGKVLGVLTAESKQQDAFSQDDFDVLTVAAQQTALAIEKARLFAIERQRVDELNALRTTMADITAELELSNLLKVIVERAAELLNATGGELGLYDENSQEITIVVSHNLGKDYLGCKQALGEGAMGRVAETKEILVIDDYQTWEGSMDEYSEIHASLAVPLMIGNRLLGVFSTVSYDPQRKFTPADLHQLNLFAQQAAIAIDNAHLFENAQREIAERKRAEAELRDYQEHLEELVDKRTAELRKSEERYRSLFDGVPVGLYRTTPSGKLLDANLALIQMMDYTNREEMLALDTATHYIDLEEHSRWKELLEKEGVVRDFETQLQKYDGTIIWGNETARAVKDENGQIIYYEGSLEDISARKQAEAELQKYQEHLEELVEERTTELQESEKRYRSLFDGVPIGLYRSTPAGQTIDANPAMLQMLGYPDLETMLVVDTAIHYLNPEDQLKWRELLEQEGIIRDFEVQGRRYDGTTLWFNDSARAVKDEQGKVLYYEGSAEDISERIEIEAELRNQKEYFESLFVNSPVAIITADLNGTIVSWNPMAEQLYGYSKEEVLGKNLDDIVARDESIREEAVRYTKQVINEGRVESITKRTRKDGTMIDVEMLALPVIVSEEEIGFIVIYVDITDLQEARRQAEAANKAKSSFLANMSHELRTPLNAVMGFTQLMERDANLTTTQQENLSIINRSGEHLLTLINDVLKMSKIEAGRETLQEKSFDLYLPLGSLEEMFRLRTEEKGLALYFEYDENLPRYVITDENKLRQVLTNLLGNAVKFTQSGHVRLRVNSSTGSAPDAQEKVLLHFEVEDTGPGISPEELGEVFEPFVQAQSEQLNHEGTGLGLSISQQFVHLMGGDISVRSKIGVGSTFAFDILIQLAEEGDIQETHSTQRVVGLEPDQPQYRILVVDELESNRRLLVELLKPLGFEIKEANNGLEAVEVWKQWMPQLIWMDLRMPVMDGHEATRKIKSYPEGQDTVIIALTASAFIEDRERILMEGCDDFLRKPFRQEEIFDMLKTHIGVQYIYEEQPVQSVSFQQAESTSHPPDMLPPVKLGALPAGWLEDLKMATIKADQNKMLKLIHQIEDNQPTLALAITELTLDYRYEEILLFIEQSGG